MKIFNRFACLGLLLAVSQTGCAGPLTCKVFAAGANRFEIVFQTVVDAPPMALWAVLTNYDHHAEFLPYLTRSKVVKDERQGTGDKVPLIPLSMIVEQEGTIRVLWWTYSLRVTQEVTHHPPAEMLFKAIAGDFEELEGTWTLAPQGTATALECRFTVQPKRRVPGWAVKFAARRYLTKMVQALQKQAEQVSNER